MFINVKCVVSVSLKVDSKCKPTPSWWWMDHYFILINEIDPIHPITSHRPQQNYIVYLFFRLVFDPLVRFIFQKNPSQNFLIKIIVSSLVIIVITSLSRPWTKCKGMLKYLTKSKWLENGLRNHHVMHEMETHFALVKHINTFWRNMTHNFTTSNNVIIIVIRAINSIDI